jgi:hypothetical protein
MTIREQAIRLCELAASAEFASVDVGMLSVAAEIDQDACDLADEAFISAMLVVGGCLDRIRVCWAEAGQILREGWYP